MLKPRYHHGRWSYSVLSHPVSRVLKFDRFMSFLEKLPRGGTVLDYGAGDRPYEELLLERFDKYIAADYLAANEAHAARPDIEIANNAIDLDSASVDCVVATEVMEHLYEPKLALREMHRVLKPGGFLIGTVPFAMNEHEEPHDFHRYTSFCLTQMFAETGFQCERLEYVGDSVGVAMGAFSRVLGISTKGLHKLHLKRLAWMSQFFLRFPEYGYWLALRCGVNFQRIGYYRAYPFGFAFLVRKP